ncbi:MAG: HypC/HybG/HupF family hydrogenase formation chaperone [Planctomycetota bacterium]|nr:HypC/HybG/HupF family hydrogenase formation chaperone [Planctomycetota bacterium]
MAVPAQLVECDETEAVVDLHGNRLRINTMLVPDLKVGDWILVHAGFAIQAIDAQNAADTWAVLQDAQRLIEEAEAPAHPTAPRRR